MLKCLTIFVLSLASIAIAKEAANKKSSIQVDRAPANSSGSLALLFKCASDQARMEIYGPLDTWDSSVRVLGYYALDLSGVDEGKSKHLEPVMLGISKDQKSMVVDQFTRGLPLTNIPRQGGVVNFDLRFGVNAKCQPE